MEISILISSAALLVSIGSFLHTIIRNVSQGQLELAEERSSLLTKIVELKLEYEQEVNYLSWLADIAHRHNLSNANELTRKVISFKGYVSNTQEYYDMLNTDIKAPKDIVLKIKHHVDSLRARVKIETANLKRTKEEVQSLVLLYNEEKD